MLHTLTLHASFWPAGNTSRCTDCQSGWLDGTSGKCLPCAVANCTDCYNGVNTCDSCDYGMTFDNTTNTCRACGANCGMCDTKGPGACDDNGCTMYFGLVNGKCVACTANCTNCDGGKCTLCDNGTGEGSWHLIVRVRAEPLQLSCGQSCQ